MTFARGERYIYQNGFSISGYTRLHDHQSQTTDLPTEKNALTHFFHLFHFCTDEDKHSHTHTYTLAHMVWHVLNDFRVYIHVCTVVHYQCHVLLFFIEKEAIRYTHRRKTTT